MVVSGTVNLKDSVRSGDDAVGVTLTEPTGFTGINCVPPVKFHASFTVTVGLVIAASFNPQVPVTSVTASESPPLTKPLKFIVDSDAVPSIEAAVIADTTVGAL